MFLYFEDWSEWLGTLDKRSLAHGDKIIKIYASREHPRAKYVRETMTVIEVDHSPFRSDESFSYGERGTYSGLDIETHLKSMGLSPEAEDRVRALFRFANQPETQFTQEGMAIKKDGAWLITHPLEEIDGLENARNNPAMRETLVHLDIFVASSLQRLYELIGYKTAEGEVDETKIISRSEREAVAREEYLRRRKEG